MIDFVAGALFGSGVTMFFGYLLVKWFINKMVEEGTITINRLGGKQ